MKKKVFRIWKMLERDLSYNLGEKALRDDIKLDIECLKTEWPQKMDGKTKEEFDELGFLWNDNWAVEE